MNIPSLAQVLYFEDRKNINGWYHLPGEFQLLLNQKPYVWTNATAHFKNGKIDNGENIAVWFVRNGATLVEYYCEDKRHNLNGPASIYLNSDKVLQFDGTNFVLTDQLTDRNEYYYIMGAEMSEEEFRLYHKRQGLKRIFNSI